MASISDPNGSRVILEATPDPFLYGPTSAYNPTLKSNKLYEIILLILLGFIVIILLIIAIWFTIYHDSRP